MHDSGTDTDADFDKIIAGARRPQGPSLLELSERAPTLVVFLRHLG